jgi:hypothetical protein
MMGMEKMLASMIGLTPEQMREMVDNFQQGFLQFIETSKAMNEKLDFILAEMERSKNDIYNGDNDGTRELTFIGSGIDSGTYQGNYRRNGGGKSAS